MEDTPRENRVNNNGSDEDLATAEGEESHREELLRLMYKPRPRYQHEGEAPIESFLSVIPYTVLLKQDDPGSNAKTATTATSTSTSTSTDQKSSTGEIPSTKTSNNSDHGPTDVERAARSPATKASGFASVSYLDLRRNQNILFCDRKSSEAEKALSSKGYRDGHVDAKDAWQEALTLVPDHLPSLLGLGKLRSDIGRLSAGEVLLRRALVIDPENSKARTYLTELEERKRAEKIRKGPQRERLSTNNKALTARESSAYQDALLERRLLASPPREDPNDSPDDSRDSSPLLSRDRRSTKSSDRRRLREDRRRKHRKRRRDGKRRKDHRKRDRKRPSRRSRRTYSSDDDDDDDDDDSQDTGDSSSPDDFSPSSSSPSPASCSNDDNASRSLLAGENRDDASVASKRRHRKRKRRKQRHREHAHRSRRSPRRSSTKKSSSRRKRSHHHEKERQKRSKTDSPTR